MSVKANVDNRAQLEYNKGVWENTRKVKTENCKSTDLQFSVKTLYKIAVKYYK